jgi:dCTP diphosphatase
MTEQRLVDVSNLEAALKKFAAQRGWERFHSPKNLAMALTGEVGELVEHFQWLTEEESRLVAQDATTAQPIKDELADVLLYLVRLASVLGIDLNEAATEKLAANTQKYPVGTAPPSEWGARK